MISKRGCPPAPAGLYSYVSMVVLIWYYDKRWTGDKRAVTSVQDQWTRRRRQQLPRRACRRAVQEGGSAVLWLRLRLRGWIQLSVFSEGVQRCRKEPPLYLFKRQSWKRDNKAAAYTNRNKSTCACAGPGYYSSIGRSTICYSYNTY